LKLLLLMAAFIKFEGIGFIEGKKAFVRSVAREDHAPSS
jgi:hypothetical protein